VRLLTLAVLLTGSIATQGALAQPANQDDLKWVNQCIQDNRDEGASASVVRAYCVCMNEKMDSNETRSITQWEKSNPSARRACERQSGWR
jgi:phage terminase large subunit-like protein